jgi:predicted Zn finger-like uncharacterized protein
VQFSCDSCKTLLQIADEKVRGKRLVVRCKRCGAKITISDPLLANKQVFARPVQPKMPGAGVSVPAPAAPAPAPIAPAPAPVVAKAPEDESKRDSDTESTVAMDSDLLERAVQASKSENPEQVLAASRPPPVTSDPAIWFAMLQGKQVGPLTRAELSARTAGGEVGPRTYLWKEGMDSWQRARDVNELSALFPLPALAPVASIPAPPVPEPAVEKPAASEAPAVARDEAFTNPELMPLGEQVHQDEVAQQLFTSGEHPSQSSAADLASWANTDLGKPSNPGIAKARPAPIATPTAVAPAKPVTPAQPAPRMFESAAPPRSRAPLVLFVLALIAAAALAVWVYMNIEKNPSGAPPPASETPDASVPAPPPPAAKPAPVSPIETPAVPAAGLSAEQVRKKLDENKGNLQTCIDDALKRDPNLRVGRIHLITTIAPSGQVSASKIDKRAVDESTLGVCLKRSTGKLVFPSFQGKAFDVDIPISVGE